ncbi:MAG: putative vancomycin resistance protein, partial [Modestobacter sp.]|nr:putative vancomycin resistance protein [Modestobacter sp.]
MPQDSPREADTVRLHPDGTIGRGRPAPPAPPPGRSAAAVAVDEVPRPSPTADPAAADDPATAADAPATPSPSDTQVIEPADPASADDAPAPPSPSDTQVISPADAEPDPADTVVVDRVPDTAESAAAPADGDGPGEPPVSGDAPGSQRSWWRSRSVLVPAAAVLALGAVYGIDLLAAGGDVPRGTVVAGVHVGGLSPAAASERLQNDLAPRINADRTLVADDVQGILHPPAAGVTLDVPGTVDAVDDQPLNPWTRLISLFADRSVDPVLAVDETSLQGQIEALASTVDRAPVDASISLLDATPSMVEPVAGRTLDRSGTAAAITTALETAGDPADPIDVPVDVADVHVDAAEAQRVLDETVTPALAAPVTVVGADGQDSVELPATAIAASLVFTPNEDGT